MPEYVFEVRYKEHETKWKKNLKKVMEEWWKLATLEKK